MSALHLLKPGARWLIRTDGSCMSLQRHASTEPLRLLIGAPQALDVVQLRRFGLVMIVDDTGMCDGRPVNAAATELYHSVCRPGTTHCIHGDVVVVPDADFE